MTTRALSGAPFKLCWLGKCGELHRPSRRALRAAKATADKLQASHAALDAVEEDALPAFTAAPPQRFAAAFANGKGTLAPPPTLAAPGRTALTAAHTPFTDRHIAALRSAGARPPPQSRPLQHGLVGGMAGGPRLVCRAPPLPVGLLRQAHGQLCALRDGTTQAALNTCSTLRSRDLPSTGETRAGSSPVGVDRLCVPLSG
jgi:hypothetical protein